MTTGSHLEAAREVADAVLYEGYVLFPYRASADKNRYRWQWGVVVPEEQVDLGATEPAAVWCEVPVRGADAEVVVTVRFLQLRHRQVTDADGQDVEQLEVDGELHVTWDEGIEREITTPGLALADLFDGVHGQPFHLPAAQDVDTLADGAQVRRTTAPLQGHLEVAATPVDDDVARLRVQVRNTTPWSRRGADRDDVLRRSLVGAHLVIGVDHGTLGSVVDPAPWATDAASGCRSRHVHPVLVGDDDRCVLAAPIILEDHPAIAPESPGPSFDGLEIDELLSLCVQALSDDEKREARATDDRAAELIDRTEALPPAVLDRLHGAVRRFGPAAMDMRPEPEARVDAETAEFLGVGEEPLEQVSVDGQVVEVGDRVRLRPGRRADAHDLFVVDRVATVERIVRTVDDEETLLAVTLVDDPAADLHRWYGRFQYFHLDEVVPLPVADDVQAES